MSKFKIEKVEHNFISMLVHTCCVVDYVKKYDELHQYNYITEENAKKDKDNNTVGIWRIKSLKNKNN